MTSCLIDSSNPLIFALSILKFMTKLPCDGGKGGNISDRENEFKSKTALIRKVTNFIEKNACSM